MMARRGPWPGQAQANPSKSHFQLLGKGLRVRETFVEVEQGRPKEGE